MRRSSSWCGDPSTIIRALRPDGRAYRHELFPTCRRDKAFDDRFFAIGSDIKDRPLVYAPSAALMMHARLRRKASRPSRFVGFGAGKLDDPPVRRQGFEDEALAIAALPLWKKQETLIGASASGRAFLTRSSDAM